MVFLGGHSPAPDIGSTVLVIRLAIFAASLLLLLLMCIQTVVDTERTVTDYYYCIVIRPPTAAVCSIFFSDFRAQSGQVYTRNLLDLLTNRAEQQSEQIARGQANSLEEV